jgi:hypothetical protein
MNGEQNYYVPIEIEPDFVIPDHGSERGAGKGGTTNQHPGRQ